MNLVDRYLIRNILSLTAIVAFGLISIYTLVGFMAELGTLSQDGFSIWQLVEYAAVLVPGNAYTLSPLIVLFGTLLGLGNMARHAEITAMRAAGISKLRVGKATLLAGLFLGAMTFVLGNWLGPIGQRQANQMRHQESARPGGSQWLRDGREILRIRQLRSADRIDGLTIYTIEKGHLMTVLRARNAIYSHGFWQLQGIRRSNFKDGHIVATRQTSARWRRGIAPSVLKLMILKKNSITTHGLIQLIRYLEVNHLDTLRYRMLLWRKLVAPVTIVAMMLFALPFAEGRLRDSGTGQRLLLGVAIGIVFYVLDKVSVSLGDIYGWWPPLAAGAPTFLLAAAGGWSLVRSS